MCRLGLEFEFTGVTRLNAAVNVAKLFGTGIEIVEKRHLDIPYDAYRVSDNEGRTWRFLRDRSIKPQDADRVYLPVEAYDYCVELVTPVLDSSDMGLLYKVLETLRGIGAFANDSCGVHVHIDKPSIYDGCMLLRRFIQNQSKIINDFNVNMQRLEKFCKMYDTDVFIPSCTSYDELLKYLGDVYLEDTEEQRSLRYYALNIYAVKEHNTIEFRLFNGSLDYDEAKSVIDFVVDFCDMRGGLLCEKFA